ncbi:MAG TPA: sigma-70 family RNA polymerase sigma factor [Acidimicrobiales bacterium]
MESAEALGAAGVVALSWRGATPAEAVEAHVPAHAQSEAFEAVYWPLFLRAFRLAYRIVANRAEAEDIAAEALARAHLHWSKVGTLPYRDAWVLRVASNLSRSAVRRRRRDPDPSFAAPFDDAVVVRAAVDAAVSSLPRRQREAISLRFLAGLDLDEIAACLGISTESTRTHIRRGLGALRTQLTLEESDLALD